MTTALQDELANDPLHWGYADLWAEVMELKDPTQPEGVTLGEGFGNVNTVVSKGRHIGAITGILTVGANGYERTFTTTTDVAASDVMLTWFETGAWGKVFARSQAPLTGTASDPAVLVARAFVMQVNNNTTVHMTNSAVAAQIAGSLAVLVASGDLTDDDVARTLALATHEVVGSRAAELGLGDVNNADVVAALNANGVVTWP